MARRGCARRASMHRTRRDRCRRTSWAAADRHRRACRRCAPRSTRARLRGPSASGAATPNTPMPPALRDRRDDVAAMGEREDRELETELLGEGGSHRSVSSAGRMSWKRRRPSGRGDEALQQAARSRSHSGPPSRCRAVPMRLNQKCRFCSSVQPMPPCTWVETLAISRPISETWASTWHAITGASSGIASKLCAAYQSSDRAGSSSAIISAHMCFTAWNEPITRSNCLRSFAYATACSIIDSQAPRVSAARAMRPASSIRADGFAGIARRRRASGATFEHESRRCSA